MAADSGTYEHNDLVLAATASLEGIDGEMSKVDGKVLWTYPQSDHLAAFLLKFHAGNYRVEPRRFARRLRSTRNRVYEIMEYNPPRVSPEARSEAS
jgi:hypothetical protein